MFTFVKLFNATTLVVTWLLSELFMNLGSTLLVAKNVFVGTEYIGHEKSLVDMADILIATDASKTRGRLEPLEKSNM